MVPFGSALGTGCKIRDIPFGSALEAGSGNTEVE